MRLGAFLVGYPGALCGLAFAAGVLAEMDSRSFPWSGLVAAGSIVAVALDRRRRGKPEERGPEAPGGTSAARRLVIAVVFFLLGGARYRAVLETRDLFSPSPPRGPVTIIGTVVRPPLEGVGRRGSNAGAQTSLEVLCRDWTQPLRVVAPTPLSGVRGGDTIRVAGKVALAAEPRSPGELREANSRTPLTVQVELRESVRLAPFDGQYGARALGQVRQHLYDILSEVYSAPTRGYLLSILLGDRRLLDPRLRNALLYTGTYHFLAISGLHLGLVMFVVLRVPLPRRLRLVLRLLFLAGFAVLTGGNPPVLRAALLFGLTLLSSGSSRFPRPLNTLGWTALLLLAWNPVSIGEIGFQLSFVAVLALTVLDSRLWRPFDRDALLQRELRTAERAMRRTKTTERFPSSLRLFALFGWTRTFLRVSLTAFLGTSPLILHHFHRVHLLSPLWNLLAYPFTFATLLGGALSLGLGCVHQELAGPVALLVDSLVDLMVVLLERASEVPGSTLHLPAPGMPVLLLSYAFLGSWVSLSRRASRLATGVLILALATSSMLLSSHAPRVWTFDARRGGASLVAGTDAEALLIGADPASDHGAQLLARAVLATGHRELRALTLPPPHRARAQVVTALCDRLNVREVWVSPQFQGFPAGRGTVDQLKASETPLRVVGRGSSLVAASGGEPTLETLYPLRDDGLLERVHARDTSLVFRLTYADRHVLFTGGLGDPGIARFVSTSERLEADVLVFPRGGPGRRLWAELLVKVDPRYVILIGRGRARDRRLARRIERWGVKVLATWRRGAVVTEWVRGCGWVARYWRG